MHTFEIEIDPKSLAPLRNQLRDLLTKAGLSEKGVNDTLLSVDEVLANVMRHGYGESAAPEKKHEKIRITLQDEADRIEVTIQDRCHCFDPRKIPEPKLPRKKPGGLGIHLVRTLMDGLEYESLKPEGNRLRLIKYKSKRKGEDGKKT